MTSGFNISYTTNSDGTVTAVCDSPMLIDGNTIVNGSRQAGVMQMTGYNGSSTISLTCGHQYQVAVQTQCINPDNNHPSTGGWQQNVGIITMDPCAPPSIPGCMDTIAMNYDCATALNAGSVIPCSDGVTVDDGSCQYGPPVHGCMDPALVINIAAPAPGENAMNYDPNFTHDCSGVLSGPDNSCCLWRGCTDPSSAFYDAQANTPDHNVDYTYCTLRKKQGCTDPLATNYDPTATVDDGSCTYGPPSCGTLKQAIHPPFNVEVELGWDPRMPQDYHVFDAPEYFDFGMMQSHFMLEQGNARYSGVTNYTNSKTTDVYNLGGSLNHGLDKYPPGKDFYGEGGYISLDVYKSDDAPTSVGGYNSSASYNPWDNPNVDLQHQLTSSGLVSGYRYFPGFDPIASRNNQANLLGTSQGQSYSDTLLSGTTQVSNTNYYIATRGYIKYSGGQSRSGMGSHENTLTGVSWPSQEMFTTPPGYAAVYNPNQMQVHPQSSAEEITTASTANNDGFYFSQPIPFGGGTIMQPYWFSGGWTRRFGFSTPDSLVATNTLAQLQYNSTWVSPFGSPPSLPSNPITNKIIIYKQEVFDANGDKYCPRNFTIKPIIVAAQGTDVAYPSLYSADDGSGETFATQQELVDYFVQNYAQMHADGWVGPGPVIP